MANCPKATAEAIKTTNEYYNSVLDPILAIVKDMTEKGADPQKYYDPEHKQVVNLVQLARDLDKQRDDDVRMIRREIQRKCRSDTDEYLQAALDLTVAYYTAGLSLVLPQHMTHIDAKEIREGKFLGGKNSIINETKEFLFGDVLGMGKNHDLRRFIDNPVNYTVQPVQDVLKRWGLPW